MAAVEPRDRLGISRLPGDTWSADDGPSRVLALLERMIDRVHTGSYDTRASDGILFDGVVGEQRCLLLVREQDLTVHLSPREREIARLVASGCTNHAIASVLDISSWTVSTHLRRIFAKLRVSSRAEMVAHLLGQPGRSGIIVDQPVERLL